MEYIDKKLEIIYQPEIEFKSFKLIKPMIHDKAKEFFSHREIYDFELASDSLIVSDIFFKKIDFPSFFYNKIFRDIAPNEFKVKYEITINSEITDQYCQSTNIKYSTINLYNKPILYYIHITVEEISALVRKELERRSLL